MLWATVAAGGLSAHPSPTWVTTYPEPCADRHDPGQQEAEKLEKFSFNKAIPGRWALHQSTHHQVRSRVLAVVLKA